TPCYLRRLWVREPLGGALGTRCTFRERSTRLGKPASHQPGRSLRMFRIALLLCLCAAAGLPAENLSSQPKNQAAIFVGNVLPQIAAGSGWSTGVQVMHSLLGDVPQGVTHQFFDHRRNPFSVPVTRPGAVPEEN